MLKRGISPLISSVLLIAFVITLFLVITNFISGSVEDTVSSSDDRLSNALASSNINFKIKNVNLVDEDTIKVNFENIGEDTIEGFSVRVVGSNGVDVVEVSESISELNVFNKEIDFDNSKVGAVLEVEVYPSVNGQVYGGNFKKKELSVAESCMDILDKNSEVESGNYDIEIGGKRVSTYCDMETDGGGWTLVWVGTGKKYSKTGAAQDPNNNAILIDTYVAKVDRKDISSGTSELMQSKLIETWPYYTEIYYERWLPDSLIGRSYASPGWLKDSPRGVSSVPTNMNFWSSSRTDTQGWDFSIGEVCASSAEEPLTFAMCHQMPDGNKKRHIFGCWGCYSNYLWFQRLDAWNGFFPDSTYGYWRISDTGNYNQPWSEYDALSEGDQMPGYGMYVR